MSPFDIAWPRRQMLRGWDLSREGPLLPAFRRPVRSWAGPAGQLGLKRHLRGSSLRHFRGELGRKPRTWRRAESWSGFGLRLAADLVKLHRSYERPKAIG